MNRHALLALQTIDSELDLLAGRRQRLPERSALAAADASLAAALDERTRLEQIVADSAAEVERAEHDGSELQRQQSRLEAQLKTVIAPREAEALMHEIDTVRARHRALDDLELAAMERQADADAALGALASVEEEARTRVAAATAALDAALVELDAEIEAVGARRQVAEQELSAQELDLYAAARRRHGGVGVARIDGRACSGCHLDMSQGELEEVRGAPPGAVPECPNCGRLIVV